MKINANMIRPGFVLDHGGKQFSVTKIQLITPGKGGAFITVEMRDVRTGIKTNERWRTADTVEKLETAQREAQFLYAEGDVYTFMDNGTFDQFTLTGDILGEQAGFLQSNMVVTVDLVENSPISIQLPATVTLAVTEAAPVVRGQTAASSYKPAVLENGMRTMVPPHIETGTRVVINTTDLSYVERAKN